MSLNKLLSSLGRGKRRGSKKPDADLGVLCGMTSHLEREHLENYARKIFTGAGQIVDLGSWLGSLTISLLVGLKGNPTKTPADVHAYDLFEWMEWMDPFQAEAGFRERLKAGDSFLPEFVRRVLPYDTNKRLLIHAGDLQRLGWCGRKIELLVVDVMKSWDLANCVIHDFYPFLIPGQSYVFHQDFCHYYTPWIHLIQYRLRHHFERVASLAGSGTVVFKYTKPFPPELLAHNYSFQDFSDHEIEEAFDFSVLQVDVDQLAGRQCVLAAKVMVFVHKNDPARARRELAAIAARGFALEGELKSVSETVNQMLEMKS